jgi:translation initiation factor 4A
MSSTINLGEEKKRTESKNHFYINVEKESFKLECVVDLLSRLKTSRAIVYVDDLSRVELLREHFITHNVSTILSTIHHLMTYEKRAKILSTFLGESSRSSNDLPKCLITSDLLGPFFFQEGIEITVINYDLPLNERDYYYKDDKNVTINFVTSDDFSIFENIKEHIQVDITEFKENMLLLDEISFNK